MLSKKVKQLEDRFDLVCSDYRKAIGRIACLESAAKIQDHIIEEQKTLIRKLRAEVKSQSDVIEYNKKMTKEKSHLADFAVWAYNKFEGRSTKDAIMIMRKLDQLKILK